MGWGLALLHVHSSTDALRTCDVTEYTLALNGAVIHVTRVRWIAQFLGELYGLTVTTRVQEMVG